MEGCLLATCGDGFRLTAPGDSGLPIEECDQGPDGGPTCNPDCTVSGHCGDGVTNPGEDEECDDGAPPTGKNGQLNFCNTKCTARLTCGDGIVTPPEVCDKGLNATTAGPPCNADCDGFAPHCGDGKKAADEACDRGTANDDNLYNGCTLACQLGPRCGDGEENGDGVEECDDGDDNQSSPGYSATEAGAECSLACTLGPYCGDDTVQSAYEICEGETKFQVQLSTGGTEERTCSECGYCGDGRQNGKEGCDLGPYQINGPGTGNGHDGNEGDVTSCRDDCTRCGDGVKQSVEYCDEGEDNQESGNSRSICRTDCTYCGDGVTQAGETCDDGPRNAGSGAGVTTCRSNCTYCGDGIVQNGVGGKPENFESCEGTGIRTILGNTFLCVGCRLEPYP